MRTVLVSSKQILAFSAVVLLAALCSVTQVSAQGGNAVWLNSTTPTQSFAFIDASAFCPSGGCTSSTDFCQTLHAALVSAGSSSGAVIDARGIIPSSSQACAPTYYPNPFAGITTPTTVLLPASTIVIQQAWILPSNTRLVGVEPTTSTSTVPAPTLQAISGFTTDFSSAMLEMGGSSSAGTCLQTYYGISIEHLTLDGNNQSLTGIYNGCAQDQSYVNDINMKNLNNIGLDVEGGSSGAAGSGPYTNINFVPTCSMGTPSCVVLNAQTHGVHGITCIGTVNTGASCSSDNAAAIYVNWSNNSIENAHTESYCDGVQVGNVPATTPVGNVVISNLTSGLTPSGGGCSFHPTVNTVHICGEYNQGNSHGSFGSCTNNQTSNYVSDVTVLQATDQGFGSSTTVLRDDVTNTSIKASGTNPLSLGIYALGETVGAGYSRFSTSPSGAITGSSVVPTWGVGVQAITAGSSCKAQGAIYSNTTGTSGSGDTIYICTIANGWQPKI